MKLATRIFERKRGTGANEYYMTSAFGYRKDPKTGVITYHNGCDYGTHGKKWAQHALEDGIVEAAYKDSNGAKVVRIRYDRLGYRCTHGHLDTIKVKVGDKVNHKTIIGNTGKSGYATGVHLHLGVQKIGSSTWINPESIDYTEEPIPTSNNYKCLGDMYVRYGAGLNYGIKRVKELSEDGRKHCTNPDRPNADAVYKVGTIFTALEIINNKYGTWAKSPSGYICIKGASGREYCTRC